MSLNSDPKIVEALSTVFDRKISETHDKKISVSPLVSEVATLYEKFRNAIDYREDEVLLRSSIDRILKRHLFFGGKGKTIAPSLIRELLWARYFPEGTISESIVEEVADIIDLYLELQNQIYLRHKNQKNLVTEWVMQLMSSEIALFLRPNPEKQLLTNLMFQVIKSSITILDDSEQTRDIQIFIAVHRSFAKDDLALLRFHLFKQYFGKVTENTVGKIADDFFDGIKSITEQLNYPLKDRIYSFTRKRTVPFIILEEVLRRNKGTTRALLGDEERLKLQVLKTCGERYDGIIKKVQRALIRSVIFLVISKALLGLALEGTFESIFYGSIMWEALLINIFIPPFLMIFASFFINIPGKENSIMIWNKIKDILETPDNAFRTKLSLKKNASQFGPYLNLIFIALWLLALTVGFGLIIYLLTLMKFNPVSQALFVFFVAIISFLSYRINQIAQVYSYGEKRQSLSSVVFEFLFMPFIQVGRHLTVGISKVNLFLFVFDFIIETPFKGVFGFFEQWFLYLRAQREKLD